MLTVRPLRGRLRAGRSQRALVAAALTLACLAAWVAVPGGQASADTVRDQQMWVLDALHAPAAWQVTLGQGTLVAVIDSGVNPNVSDLTGSVVTGPDFTGLRTPPSNPGWGVHGTWMASLIAGHGHAAGGGSGILGVAPRSRILSIRVLADRGDPGYRRLQHEQGDLAQEALAKAIRYATAHGADVISMSLGNGAASQLVRAALQHALNRGVVVVASTGNAGGSAAARRGGQAPYSFPADYPGVLGVGALSQSGAPAGFSSDNLSVQVSAPGVNVPAQGRDGQYWLVSGTSPACALTAGAAALIKARYPRLPPALVMQAIVTTAQNPPPGGYDNRVGAGAVDAAAALAAAARLSRYRHAGGGVSVAAHFGGGPGAVPPVPVPPRGKGALLLYAILVLVSLAMTLVSARAVHRARAATGGGRSGQPGAGPPLWPGAVPPARPEPDATPWPGTGAPSRSSGIPPARPGPSWPGDVRAGHPEPEPPTWPGGWQR